MKAPTGRLVRAAAVGVLLGAMTGCSLVQAAVPAPPPIYDFVQIIPERPSDAPQATVIPKVESVSTPRPSAAPRPSSTTRSVKGIATYYCCTRGYPSGNYAAAGPAIRIGHWRGRYVQVCGKVCVQVRLVDWCACGGGHTIDLYPEVFRRLAPLSAGVVRVTVKW